jgi:diketogulonate reductase-like aldo/keto reductase
MKAAKSYELSNGVLIPSVGFGTWRIENGADAVSATRAAIDTGYRHIDTAAAYGNEESVGRAVRESGVPRGEIFLTSKLPNPMHGYENTKTAFEETLKKLGTDYLDLYLVHWPNPIKFRDRWQEANAGTWRAFEEFYRAGRVRAVGISNFHQRHIEPLLETAEIAPMVNQIRLCPGDTQDAVVDFSREKGMLLEAYSPLGSGAIFEVPEMKEIAEKHGKTVAQICVRWSLERGYLPLPKSQTPVRIRENLEVFDFELSKEDHDLIAGLVGCVGFSSDPDKTSF